MARPDVFAYLDYRAFLRDYYLDAKATRRMSHRALARRTGIKSPSFLRLVMHGERNLAIATARRLAVACGLEGDAADWFVALVELGQAESGPRKRAAHTKLQRFARYRDVQLLAAARTAGRYHRAWYASRAASTSCTSR